jgi:hypothetical protein
MRIRCGISDAATGDLATPKCIDENSTELYYNKNRDLLNYLVTYSPNHDGGNAIKSVVFGYVS